MEMIVVTLVISSIVLVALFLLSRSSRKGAAKNAYTRSGKEAVKTYTKEEVSRHNSRDDCWIIVKGKVYDVTPYVFEHPGADAILNNAGGDSTEGFYGLDLPPFVVKMTGTIIYNGKRPQHATRVFDMVEEFYIGELKS